MRQSPLITAAVPALVTLAAAGQTITVDTSSDTIDFTGARTVADLPGPDGRVSLREAGLASDNTPGVQTIAFNVPQDEWEMQWLYPGRVVLQPWLGFRVFDTAIIDATTQTDFTGDTNPDGAEVVIWGDDIFVINNVGGVVRGFDSCEIFISGGSGNVVQGNTATHVNFSNTSSNLIGGTGPGEGNTGGTLKLDGQANDNLVVGNTFQRLRVLGANDNVIGGPAPEDRNHFTGYGYWNSSGLPSGTTVQLWNTVGTVLENNTIGTTPDGLAQGHAASSIGVSFEGTNEGVVVRDNLIGGIRATGIGTWAGYLFGHAVIFWGSGGSNIELTGNTIGLDANGEPVLGSVWGIDVGNANGAGAYDDVRIVGNAIAGHVLNGVTIGREASPIRLSANEIHDNGWLGIDLIPTGYGYGVTPNDPLDADTGGNGLQNFPDLDTATAAGSSTHVTGALHSTPRGDFTVEFFASPACDDDGHGEGQIFLGATDVTTDAGGDAAFNVLLPGSVAAGWVITATATLEPIGATSEFSACIPVEGGSMPGDATGDGVVGVDDMVAIISAWGACADPGSCPADVDFDGDVDVDDLVMCMMHWS